MKVRRVVIDTNVLISAALSASTTPATAVRLVLSRGRLLFSPATFAEFETRLWRPKFDRYLSIETRKALLHDFDAVADWVGISQIGRYSRDPDDDKFVQTALDGDAELLISGDRDLLDMGAVVALTIMTPADAVEALLNWAP